MEQGIHLSSTQLIRAAEQLSPADLEQLALQVAELRARRNAPVLSVDESVLFARINRALPEQDRARLAELSRKRQEETLLPPEHTELLCLQQQLEVLHTDRVQALAELGRQRGLTLTEMMAQLGIQFPDHG